MITAIVKFKVADDLSQDEILDGMAKATQRFQNLPGLIRKNFLLDKKKWYWWWSIYLGFKKIS